MSASEKSSQIADRRLVEYFVIVSSVEQKHDPLAAEKKDKNKKQAAGGDISFQDWKTESSFDDPGGDYEEDAYAAYQFKPTITARYPLHDHPDNPLHDNVTFFCHPSGRIQLRTEKYMPKVSIRIRKNLRSRKLQEFGVTSYCLYSDVNNNKKTSPLLHFIFAFSCQFTNKQRRSTISQPPGVLDDKSMGPV